jgi:hypothetical protein
MVSVLVALTLLAGCGRGSGPEPVPGGSASPAPTSTAPPVTDITDAAFLQLEDIGVGKWVRFVTDALGTDAVAPCYKSYAKTDSQLAYREEKVGSFKFSNRPVEQPDGTVYHVISAYRPGGAAAYLTEVREQIARCANTVHDDGVVTLQRSILAEGFAGDESLLWTRKMIYQAGGVHDENFGFIGVIRFRDYVVLVHTTAKTMDGRTHADRLLAAAVKRAAALP